MDGSWIRALVGSGDGVATGTPDTITAGSVGWNTF